jgi:hypothetical protein
MFEAGGPQRGKLCTDDGLGTRPVGDYAKRTANVLGHAVRSDLLGGGAVAVALPAVCYDTAIECMDVLKSEKELPVWL